MGQRVVISPPPLHPAFQAAKRIFNQNIQDPQDYFREQCKKAGIDKHFVAAIMPAAAKHPIVNKAKKKKNKSDQPLAGQPDFPLPAGYNFIVAGTVAACGGQEAAIWAALFEQTIADNPLSGKQVFSASEEALANKNILTGEHHKALKEGLRMAERGLAPFSRIPRLGIVGSDTPDAIYEDMQDMALAMYDPRGIIIKLVGAMTLLFTVTKDDLPKEGKLPSKQQKEADAIVTLAEKLYVPLAMRIGMNDWAEAMLDHIYPQLRPLSPNPKHMQYDQFLAQINEHMGEDFYQNAPAMIEEGKACLKTIAEAALNQGRAEGEPWLEVQITGRRKHIKSARDKVFDKRKPVRKFNDLVGYCVVLPEGVGEESYYKVIGAISAHMKINEDHCKNYTKLGEPKKSGYDAVHLVGSFVEPKDKRHDGNTLSVWLLALPSDSAEVQIMTHDKYVSNRYGIANHGVFKRLRRLVANAAKVGKEKTDLDDLMALASPIVDRAKPVTEFLIKMTHLAKGEPPPTIKKAEEIFFLDHETMRPHRMPRYANLMDALVNLNPDYIHLRQVRVDNALYDLDSPLAKAVVIRNGHTIEPVLSSMDKSRPPDQAWLGRSGEINESGEMTVSLKTEVAWQAIHAATSQPQRVKVISSRERKKHFVAPASPS